MNRFPHVDPQIIDGVPWFAEDIIALIEPYVSPPRRVRMREVIARRTYSVVTVLDNLYDRGNASAVMRSAEAMGFQSVHMVEPGDRFKKANRVTKGADKWLDVVRWKKSDACVAHLKERGYQILATSLEGAQPLAAMDFRKPTALVLGNEKDGVSPEILAQADASVIIPMQGFVQSFNISVAAAIALYHIFRAREEELGQSGDLSPQEQLILRSVYYLRSARDPRRLLTRLQKLRACEK